jgi:dihydroflavonol-4-reductase
MLYHITMILITGATGRIGNVLVKELNKNGEKVKVLVRKTSNIKSLIGCKCEYIYGDILDPLSIEPYLKDVDTIFHLVAHINIFTYNKDLTLDTNIKGTKNIVDLCLKYNIPLVYTSSIHAFDAPEDGVITETIPLITDIKKSRGIYDYSKGCASTYVKEQISKGLKAIVIHPTGVAGPFDFRPSFFGSGMIGLINSGIKTTIDGKYDYVDVRDVVGGMLRAYKLKKYGERYLLSGEILTMKDYSEYLKEFSDLKVNTKILNYNLSLFIGYVSSFFNKNSQITPYSVKTLNSNCNASHKKATKELGYNPMSIKKSIYDQYAWFKENKYFNV